MTNRSAAPPFGTGVPTDGATSTIWTGSTHFQEMLNTLVDLRLEEQLRNPMPFLLPGNYRPATLTSVKGTIGTMRYLAIGDLAVDVSDSSDIWVKIEGEPNDTEDLDFGYEEFSVKQAMKTIRLTDVADDYSPVALLPIVAERIAQWKMQTANAVLAKAMFAGTNVYRVGGGSIGSIGPGDVLTGFAIRDAVAELEAANVPTFPDGNYRALIHPFVKLDLSGDEDAGGWIDSRRYASPDNFLNGELGAYAGVRFIKSSVGAKVADAGASSNDVYRTPIFGPGALAFGDIGGGNTYFTPPGGHDDPGHQSALETWIGYLGAVVLGEGTNATGPTTSPRYILVESAVTKSVS